MNKNNKLINFFTKSKQLKNILSCLLCVVLITVMVPVKVYAVNVITLKSGTKAPNIVYVNHSYDLQVEGVSVKFYSSDKTIATVGLTGGKLTPQNPGKVTITAKNKKPSENGSFRTVATKTFTVLKRSTSVSANVTDLYMNVNDKVILKTTLTPEDSTDTVAFISSDKGIVTAGSSSGTITAVADGEATIRIYAKATSDSYTFNKYNPTTQVNVHVRTCIDNVNQESLDTINVNFKTDISHLELSSKDFTIINDDTKVAYPINDVKTEGKTATLTTSSKIHDGKSYTVTYSDQSASFTAINDAVSSICLEPEKVNVGIPTQIYVVIKDANGDILNRYELNKNNFSPITYNFETYNCSLSDDGKLTLNDITSSANISVKYHTKQYNDDKEDIKQSVSTITATNVIDNTFLYTIDSSNKTINFSSPDFKSNTSLISNLNNSCLYLAKRNIETGQIVQDDIEAFKNYTIESSDPTIMSISGDMPKLSIVGLKAGICYAVIKEKNSNTTITAFPITVAKVPVLSLLELSEDSIITEKNTGNEQTVTFKTLDQYGNEIKDNIHISSKLDSCPLGEENKNLIIKDNSINFPVFDKAGTYTFKITATQDSDNEVSAYLTVTVQESILKYEINWGSLEFTYNKEWNADTLTWEGSWLCDDNSNLISVKNLGVNDITVSPTFSPDSALNSPITVNFEDEAGDEIENLPIKPLEEGCIHISLNGKPIEDMDKKNIGNIKLIIN